MATAFNAASLLQRMYAAKAEKLRSMLAQITGAVPAPAPPAAVPAVDSLVALAPRSLQGIAKEAARELERAQHLIERASSFDIARIRRGLDRRRPNEDKVSAATRARYAFGSEVERGQEHLRKVRQLEVGYARWAAVLGANGGVTVQPMVDPELLAGLERQASELLALHETLGNGAPGENPRIYVAPTPTRRGVELWATYSVEVNGTLRPVQIVDFPASGGLAAIDETTGRPFKIPFSAIERRFHGLLRRNPPPAAPTIPALPAAPVSTSAATMAAPPQIAPAIDEVDQQEAAARIVRAFHSLPIRTTGKAYGTIAKEHPEGAILVVVKRYSRDDAPAQELGVVSVLGRGGLGLQAVTWTNLVDGDEDISAAVSSALRNVRVLPQPIASPRAAPPAPPGLSSQTLVSAREEPPASLHLGDVPDHVEQAIGAAHMPGINHLSAARILETALHDVIRAAMPQIGIEPRAQPMVTRASEAVAAAHAPGVPRASAVHILEQGLRDVLQNG